MWVSLILRLGDLRAENAGELLAASPRVLEDDLNACYTLLNSALLYNISLKKQVDGMNAVTIKNSKPLSRHHRPISFAVGVAPPGLDLSHRPWAWLASLGGRGHARRRS
ncbi:hypothetical protein MHYP_G00091720 [Metynnis hypsauchen]